MREEVYPPSEDTYLLEKALPKKLEGKKVLEVGCGSGFLSIEAALRGAEVTAIDINENALDATERLAVLKGVQDKIHLIESDLFEKVDEKFDLIFFNPPYVPSTEIDNKINGARAWAGGKKGKEVIEKFLEKFEYYLKPKGVCLLLISSLNDLRKELENKGWKCVEKTSLMDGEELFVMKFERR